MEKTNDFALRIFVAFGVAVGIALGSFRIVDGGHIHYYIIVGYIVVIILTFVAPKYIILLLMIVVGLQLRLLQFL